MLKKKIFIDKELNDISKYKSINNIINKEYHDRELSYNHNDNYNKRLKSQHKKSHTNSTKKNVLYHGYSIYRTKKLDINSNYLNYISYIKISYYIFQSILKNIYYNNYSWYIKNIGRLKFKTEKILFQYLPKLESYYNTRDKMIRIRVFIKYNKNTNLYYKRFKFSISNPVKSFIKQDYIRYKYNYAYKRKAKELNTI